MGAWETVAPWLDRLRFWAGYEQELTTLLMISVGIAVYTAIVFAFYNNLSRRDLFPMSTRAGGMGRFVRFSEVVFVFPAFNFLFFVVIAAALFIMTPPRDGITTTLTVMLAGAVVVAVRLTAFMKEEMANDLGKLLPLSLLAILVVDPAYMSIGSTWARVKDVPTLLPLMSRFLILLVTLEVTLRIVRAVLQFASGKAAPPEVKTKKRISREELAEKLTAEALSRPVLVREGPAPVATDERPHRTVAATAKEGPAVDSGFEDLEELDGPKHK